VVAVRNRADPGPGGRLTRRLAQAKHPDRPFVLDHGQVVEAVLGHQGHSRLDWRGGGDGHGLGRHPLADTRLARVDAAGEGAQEIA
jgi:hypothetical protein